MGQDKNRTLRYTNWETCRRCSRCNEWGRILFPDSPSFYFAPNRVRCLICDYDLRGFRRARVRGVVDKANGSTGYQVGDYIDKVKI